MVLRMADVDLHLAAPMAPHYFVRVCGRVGGALCAALRLPGRLRHILARPILLSVAPHCSPLDQANLNVNLAIEAQHGGGPVPPPGGGGAGH